MKKIKTIKEFALTGKINIAELVVYIKFLEQVLRLNMFVVGGKVDNVLFGGFEVSYSDSKYLGNNYLFYNDEDEYCAILHRNSVEWYENNKIRTIEELINHIDLYPTEHCINKFPILNKL